MQTVTAHTHTHTPPPPHRTQTIKLHLESWCLITPFDLVKQTLGGAPPITNKHRGIAMLRLQEGHRRVYVCGVHNKVRLCTHTIPSHTCGWFRQNPQSPVHNQMCSTRIPLRGCRRIGVYGLDPDKPHDGGSSPPTHHQCALEREDCDHLSATTTIGHTDRRNNARVV